MSGGRKLFIQTMLEYCDGPLLFLAEDAAETVYVCTFLERDSSRSQFLCSRISPSVLRRFLSGSIDLLDVITTAALPENLLLTIDDATEGEELDAVPIGDLSELDQSLLPAEGYFVPPAVGNPLLSGEYAVIETSLEINEARLAPVISTYTLSVFLRVFQDLIKYAYKKSISELPQYQRKIISDPIFYTAQVTGVGDFASFSVQFRSKQSADLSQYVEFERALNKAETLLENISLSSTIEVLRAERGHLVGAYRRLLVFLIEADASLRIKWHTPSQGPAIKRFSLGVSEAIEIQQALSTMEDLGDEFLILEGVIIQVHTETGNWTLKSDGGEIHSGKIEDGVAFTLAGIVVKTAKYRLNCKEHIKESALGVETRTLLLYEAPVLLDR